MIKKCTLIILLFLLALNQGVLAQDDTDDYPDVPYPQHRFTQMCWRSLGEYDSRWVTLEVTHDMPSYLYNLSYKWSTIKLQMVAHFPIQGYRDICPTSPPNECFFEWRLNPAGYEVLENNAGIYRSKWRASYEVPVYLRYFDPEVSLDVSGAWQMYPHNPDEQYPCFHIQRDDVCVIPFMSYWDDGSPAGLNYPIELEPDPDKQFDININDEESCPVFDQDAFIPVINRRER